MLFVIVIDLAVLSRLNDLTIIQCCLVNTLLLVNNLSVFVYVHRIAFIDFVAEVISASFVAVIFVAHGFITLCVFVAIALCLFERIELGDIANFYVSVVVNLIFLHNHSLNRDAIGLGLT